MNLEIQGNAKYWFTTAAFLILYVLGSCLMFGRYDLPSLVLGYAFGIGTFALYIAISMWRAERNR